METFKNNNGKYIIEVNKDELMNIKSAIITEIADWTKMGVNEIAEDKKRLYQGIADDYEKIYRILKELED